MFCCGKGAAGGRRARLAGIVLMHINLVLMLYAGAGLATAARFKWDPSTYILVRELLPLEYHILCLLLLGFPLVLMVLAHAALGALAASGSSAYRRPALITYAALMCTLTVVEVSAIIWVSGRINAFLKTAEAAKIRELMEMRDHLRAALQILARWYPLPEKINQLIEEAEADGPWNGYIAGGTAVMLLVLQPTTVVLSLMAASTPRGPRAQREPTSTSTFAGAASSSPYARDKQRARLKYHSESERSNGSEKAPLKTACKHGRLVIL